jgi:hypothetical protein
MKNASTLIAVPAIALLVALLPAARGISAAAVQTPEAHPPQATPAALEQQIVAHEREGLDALKTGDLDRFGNLTADEAIMVDARGPASKSQVLKNVAGFKLTEYSMEDVKLIPVSADTGLISYKITEKGISHGKEFSAQAYVSSLWTERAGKWVCLFSQETARK